MAIPVVYPCFDNTDVCRGKMGRDTYRKIGMALGVVVVTVLSLKFSKAF